MKKVVCFILGIFLVGCSAYRENTIPLRLTIKTDKNIYNVGDEIKVIFTVENNSNGTFDFYYNPYFYFGYEIIVLGDREHKLFPDQSTQQTCGTSDEHVQLAPKQTWTDEVVIARVKKGKVYKYTDRRELLIASVEGREIDIDDYRELYYEGFHISDTTFAYKGDILVKNGDGKYGIVFSICDEILEGLPGTLDSCLESNKIEIQILDK